MHVSQHARARMHPRKLAHLLVATILMLAAGLSLPETAWAAVTLVRDGLESADRATCVIDTDSYRDFTFEATEGSPIHLVTQDGTFKEWKNGTEHARYGVYIDYTPKAGLTEIPGSFEMTYANGLLDSQGIRHDLHVRFSNIAIRWRDTPNTGPVSQQLIGVDDTGLRIKAEPGVLFKGDNVVQFDPFAGGVANPVGVSCDISIWNDDDVTLLYNLYARDIDQPNRFTGQAATTCTYDGEWSESFAPFGHYGVFHVHENSWLVSDGDRIRGTQVDTDEELNRSGFVSLGSMSPSTPVGFTWRGSMCSSHILRDWSHTLKTRVVGGTGGAIHTKSGDDQGRTIKSNTADAWNSTNTVPKNDYVVTAAPDKGFRIAEMWMDGEPVPADALSAGKVTIPTVTADHTVAVRFEPVEATLSLSKSSSSPDITDNNPCYSLQGAEYGVYSDKACTKEVGRLTTTSQGTSDGLTLPAGTYYAKEAKAPQGYATDPTVHEVTVGETGDTVLKVKERPQTNPVSLLALKADAQTKKTEPQGSATLAGAQFTIRYYNQLLSSDKLPKEATRTWVLETDAQGKACLDDAHRVSGDPFYLVGDTVTIPLGTLTVEETEAPKGYLLPKDSLTLYQVSPTGDAPTLAQIPVPTEAKPNVLEQVVRGGVKVKKVDQTGNALAGATFSVTTTSPQPVVVEGKAHAKGSVCLTMVTGKDGIATTAADALPCGTYRITETKAPKGYRPDGAWSADVSIEEDGRVVDLTKNPVKNRRVSVSVPLTATKRLEGAMPGQDLKADAFSFTLAKEDGTVLQTKRNDASGAITFDPIELTYDDLGKKLVYLMREVPGSDDQMVYDRHVERVEIELAEQADGSLKAEVKTDSDGLEFVNTTVSPIELPTTGHGGILGAWAAAAASGLAIGIYLRRRSARGTRP